MGKSSRETVELFNDLINDPKYQPILDSFGEKQKRIVAMAAMGQSYAEIAKTTETDEFAVKRYINGVRVNTLHVITSNAWKKDCNPKTIGLLYLSGRTYHALKINGVDTITQLVGYTEGELTRLNKVGRRSIGEIKAVLAEHGLGLKA